MRPALIAFATTSLAASALSPTTTAAATLILDQNPAIACTLSIPSTDTKVRPRATGYRNEGTVNQFVICVFDTAERLDYGNPLSLHLLFRAYDGSSNNFDCTAVARSAYDHAGEYATLTVHNSGAGDVAHLDVTDVNAPGYNFAAELQSITCLLPPGMAILGMQIMYPEGPGA